MDLSSLSELSKVNRVIAQLIVELITKRPAPCLMEFSFTELYEHAAGIQIPTKSKDKKRVIQNALYSLRGYELIEHMQHDRYRIVADGLLDLQVQQERAYQEMEKVSRCSQ